MSFIYYNPNPENKDDIDCTIRAISKVEDISWDEAYMWVCIEGAKIHRMPPGNKVWSSYLEANGYKCVHLKDKCPNCYTVNDFCYDHPYGRYILAVLVNYIKNFTTMDSGKNVISNHVVAVVNGNYYDAWDSGSEVVTAYWYK